MKETTCTTCGAQNSTNARYCNRCGYALPQQAMETTEMPVINSRQKGKSYTVIGVITGIIVFALAYWGIQQVFLKPPSFNKVLVETASELNKSLPMMVDQYTRLDNAVALPENSLQYNYTLVNHSAEDIQLDTMKKYMEPSIINNVKTNPDLKVYRDNKVTMIYNYRDKNGVFVYKLKVTPEMYQ